MKEMKNWLANMHNQMAQMGLTDPAKKPDDVPCGTCKTPITYRWVDSQRHSFWCKGSCWKCREEEEEAKKKERRERRLADAGVPAGFWKLSLSSPLFSEPDGACARVQQLVQDWKQPAWVMITGPVGTGKTSWLTALFNYLLIEGNGWDGSLWVTEADLFERCDAAHHRSGYTARQSAMRPYIDAPLLMIDDLGASRRRLTDWQGGAMRNLFDKRHSAGRPTFITTNMVQLPEMSNRYGEHIMSRILHATNGLVYLGGKDRRQE
jgi:DNA replication protein DnaC